MSKLPAETIAQYRDVFEVFDKDKDGHITKEELKKALTKLHVDVSDEDVDRMMANVDTDGNGEIDFDEFCQMMAQPSETTTAVEDLREAFKAFDTDNDGYISKEELHQVMKELDDTMTEADIDAMMDAADTNNDGRIDFAEFERMMNDQD